MTVAELFPKVIANYEACINDVERLYDRDNQWKAIMKRCCHRGICLNIDVCIDFPDWKNVYMVLEIKLWHYLIDEPKWTNSKEENIRLFQVRIDAMKKAIEKYTNVEI